MIVENGRAGLAVEVTGDGPPDVLLLHAGVTDQRSWQPLIDRLATRGRCVSFDRRGFGRTTYDAEPGWSPVEDTVAVLDAVAAERVVVIGASMGGATALDLVLTHPGRVAALVLIGSAISGSPAPEITDAEVLRLDAAGDEAHERGDIDALNRIEATLFLDGARTPGRVREEVRALFGEMNGAALRAADPGDEADAPGAWDRLAQIAVPTLVLVGEHDLEHLHRNADHLARSVPGSRLVELPGVAHLPHLEGDERTLQEIASFATGGGAG